MRHRTILVAEDDSKVRRTIRWHLERAGLPVFEAAHFSHLAYLLRTYPAALIVLSLTLPGLPPRGSEWSSKLAPVRQGIPLLVLSPHANHRAQAIQLGAEFLRKPFDPGELVQCVLRLLSSRQGAEVFARSTYDGG